MNKMLLSLFAFAVAASAQSLSPFSPPPFSTSQEPSSCTVGQIYYNTTLNVTKLCTATNTWTLTMLGPGSSTNGNVPTWNGTTGIALGAGLPVATTSFASALVKTGGSGTLDASLMPTYFPLVVTAGTGGTINTALAKLNASGQAVTTTTTDTAIPVFIVVVQASSGQPTTMAASGLATCTFDSGGGAIGHFVVISGTTAGACHDAGSGAPSSGWVVGQVQTTASSNGSGVVALSPGYYAASGGGGGVSQVGLSMPSGFSVANSPITTTGTLQVTFANENAGVMLAGPCSGAAATPTWRALCYNDLPGAVYNLGTGSGAQTFDLSQGGVQTITMNGNVTATISNGVAGKRYSFIVCQDGTGGRSFTWPSGFHGQMTVGSTASLCSNQAFDALTNSTFYASAPGIINQ